MFKLTTWHSQHHRKVHAQTLLHPTRKFIPIRIRLSFSDAVRKFWQTQEGEHAIQTCPRYACDVKPVHPPQRQEDVLECQRHIHWGQGGGGHLCSAWREYLEYCTVIIFYFCAVGHSVCFEHFSYDNDDTLC